MTYLIFFLIGILFVDSILPIVEKLTSMLLTLMECGKGKMTVKITEYQAAIAKIEQEIENPQEEHRIIGFSIPEDEYVEEMEEEDENE